MLLDLLLPRRCVVCRAAGAQLCVRCRDALPRLTPPLCARCGAPTAWPVERCRECSGRRLAFTRARAAVAYEDDVRRLVRAWKERGLRSLAEEAAELIVARVPRPVDVDVVTFVPGEPWRSRARGHTPAERLARALADRWQLPCEPLLRRTGSARRQSGLGRADRRHNPAFTASAPRRSAVLVDDVYTTGATAHAAARALGGRVEVLTFARTVRRA
ncbi:MAG TPA: double zinc ribbon domain-containing protein [Gaiellaceae bacterium]|nr:double zinc ribbon domain-containing protein [Gaiellaceae bacterium]